MTNDIMVYPVRQMPPFKVRMKAVGMFVKDCITCGDDVPIIGNVLMVVLCPLWWIYIPKILIGTLGVLFTGKTTDRFNHVYDYDSVVINNMKEKSITCAVKVPQIPCPPKAGEIDINVKDDNNMTELLKNAYKLGFIDGGRVMLRYIAGRLTGGEVKSLPPKKEKCLPVGLLNVMRDEAKMFVKLEVQDLRTYRIMDKCSRSSYFRYKWWTFQLDGADIRDYCWQRVHTKDDAVELLRRARIEIILQCVRREKAVMALKKMCKEFSEL